MAQVVAFFVAPPAGRGITSERLCGAAFRKDDRVATPFWRSTDSTGLLTGRNRLEANTATVPFGSGATGIVTTEEF